MKQGSILNPGARSTHFAIPTGSRVDPRAEHQEVMRRHLNMGTYHLPLFLKDLYAGVIDSKSLDLHLQCVRAAESKALGKSLSAERIKEMIRGIDHGQVNLSKVDDGVIKALGLMSMAR